MNAPEQNTPKQAKRIIKKYILHQKVNPRLLGVELYNQYLDTPHEAYLSCKLIFKKDVRSLMELERMAKKIYETWTEKNDELLIKKINVFTSPAYIVLTFTIGFYEESQVKQLRELKEWAKEIIETYDSTLKEEKEAEYKRKEAEISGVLEKFSQLTKKMDGLEDRLTKNESIVLDSGEQLKTELTKVSQTIQEQLSLGEYKLRSIPSDSKQKEQAVTELKLSSAEKKNIRSENKVSKYRLDRAKQDLGALEVKVWPSNWLHQKDRMNKKLNKKNNLKRYVSKVEVDILTCFTRSEELNRKRMVPKRQFLDLKAKVEFIDYLWMLLELEGKEEIIIAGKLSCRELIEELGPFMEAVEQVAAGPTIFSYWVYCSQELLIKLEGYVALKEFLSNSLKLGNNILIK